MTTSELKKLIDRITLGELKVYEETPPSKYLLGDFLINHKKGQIAAVYGDEGDRETCKAYAELFAMAPKLLRENERLKLQNEKFESLLYQISRSVCLDQKLNGKCLCFSCEAKAALGEK